MSWEDMPHAVCNCTISNSSQDIFLSSAANRHVPLSHQTIHLFRLGSFFNALSTSLR
jgi:hypothetical protein